MNALYPDPTPVRRVRVPTGPHELVLLSVPSATGTVYVGCRCTTHHVPVRVDADHAGLTTAWRAVRHDPNVVAVAPAPRHLPGPNARYRREGET